MEERFYDIGKDWADEIRELNRGTTFPDDLDQTMAQASWEYFIADCSDDYSRTRDEKDEIKRRLHDQLSDWTGKSEILYPYRWQ